MVLITSDVLSLLAAVSLVTLIIIAVALLTSLALPLLFADALPSAVDNVLVTVVLAVTVVAVFEEVDMVDVFNAMPSDALGVARLALDVFDTLLSSPLPKRALIMDGMNM